MERLFLGVYWYNRAETIQSAAGKLCEAMQALLKIDDRYGGLKFATTAKLENKLIDFDRPAPAVTAELSNAILQDKLKDIKKYHPDVTPSTGFSEPIGFAMAFEVKAIKKMQLTAIIGGYGTGALNNLLIKFPPDLTYDFNYVQTIFAAIIRVLQPHWGVVLSRRFESEVVTQQPPAITAGWFNYFANKINVAGLEGKINTVPMEEGTLTFTTSENEVFSCDNKAHVNNTLFVIDYLKHNEITTARF